MGTAATAMEYEDVANKGASKTAVKKQAGKALDQFNTSQILWHLVIRHKFGLVLSWAITLSIIQFVPFLPGLVWEMVRHLF